MIHKYCIYKISIGLRSVVDLAAVQEYLFCNKLVFPDFQCVESGNCVKFPIVLVLYVSLERMNVILQKLRNLLQADQVTVVTSSISSHKYRELQHCESYFRG